MGCHTTLTNNSSKCPGQKHHNVTKLFFMVYHKETCKKQEGKDEICCCRHTHPLGIHRLSVFLYDRYSQLRIHIMK